MQQMNKLHPQPLLLPPFSFLLPFHFLYLLSSLQPSLSDSPNQNCSPDPYSCGDLHINISYPFLVDGGSRPEHCGHPGYSLSCADATKGPSIIHIGNKEFHVKDVDYSNNFITLVDSNFAGQFCSEKYDTTTLDTTTLDTTFFELTDGDLNITLYISCTPSSTLDTKIFHEISCLSKQNEQFKSYYTALDKETFPGKCISTAVIVMNRTAVENPELSFEDALEEGFSAKWTAGSGWCGGCSNSSGHCGYDSSSPDDHTCICSDGKWPINSCSSRSNFIKNKKIIIGSVTGIAGFLSACLLLFLCVRRNPRFHNSIIRWKKNNDQNIEAFIEKYGSLAPKRYSYSDVKKITKSFCYKLGQGGYGVVFKGTLEDDRPVAVKVLSDSKGNGEEFVNEVSSIGRTSHVNVVSLLGFCSEGSKRALIYDFMCNGSLEKFIYSEMPKTTLGWEKLYQIAIGTARGLEYLHRGCNTRIVHFDIKPHNILLDQDFCPKIADFGLAKLCPRKDSIISMAGARGTVGYIAPEVFSRNFGVVSSKSDVYSYGMMVLEMVGGRRNIDAGAENSSEIYFPVWIHEHLDQNGALQTCGVTNETEEIARKMILVGLWCIQTMPQNRPPMGRVIEMLEGSINDLEMPPKP